MTKYHVNQTFTYKDLKDPHICITIVKAYYSVGRKLQYYKLHFSDDNEVMTVEEGYIDWMLVFKNFIQITI